MGLISNTNIRSVNEGKLPQSDTEGETSDLRQLEIEDTELVRNIDSVIEEITNEGKVQGIAKNVDSKFVSSSADENYHINQPRILFISEYIYRGKFAGCLICWERYPEGGINSTHYEIYKRNTLKSQEAEFKKIFFANTRTFVKETQRYKNYIRKVLGINLPVEDIVVFHDHKVQKDRIYEYAVRALYYPSKPEDVSYSEILKSKDLLRYVPRTKGTIFNHASGLLGNGDFAWIISLLDPSLVFFGYGPKVEGVDRWLRSLSNSQLVYRTEATYGSETTDEDPKRGR